ncbi:hypothetical protein D3C76_1283130 [compost metagenome]
MNHSLITECAQASSGWSGLRIWVEGALPMGSSSFPPSWTIATLCWAPASDMRFAERSARGIRGISRMRWDSTSSGNGCRSPAVGACSGGRRVIEPADSAPRCSSSPKASASDTWAALAMSMRCPSSGSRLSKYHCTGRSEAPSMCTSACNGSPGQRG